MEYYEFKDLNFEPEEYDRSVSTAVLKFKNNYCVVVKTECFKVFHLRVLEKTQLGMFAGATKIPNISTFNLDITRERVNQLMLEIQQLPKIIF